MTILDEHFNHPPVPGSTTADQEMAALSRALKAAKLRSEEKWALKSLHFSKLQQIEEAFDADSSGYVSVWEANQVLSLRPSGWSLLQWLAYWASGRHWTISEYKLKIDDILQDMFLMLRHRVRPSNRYTVDRYLNNMKTLDRVLLSTLPCHDPPQGELANRVSRYNQQEEERMDQVLKALNYEIDGPDTIELITSRYQIERNFFPLVYLLLRRHLSVIRLACDIALDARELEQATKSLKVIFQAVKSRVATLRFTTPLGYPPDLTLVLQTFAFGMYYSVYTKWSLHYSALPNNPTLITDTQPAPVDWLVRGVPPSLESSEREFRSLHDPIRFDKCIGKYMNGHWTGYLARHDGVIRGGVLQFRISNWKGSTFDGEGCFSEGIIRIEGAYDHKKNILLARLVGAVDNGAGQGGSSDLRVFITGSLETIVSSPSLPKQYVITAVWGESKNDRSGGTATFSQTPAWIYQFRNRILDHPSYSARERWSYALNAVLYSVRCQRGVLQKGYCFEKLKCIRRSVYLLKQRYFTGTDTTAEEEETGLTWLPPSESRLCRWLALFAFWPSVHFNAQCGCKQPVIGKRLLDIQAITTPDGLPQTMDVCLHDLRAHMPPILYGAERVKVSRFLHRRDEIELQEIAHATASYVRSLADRIRLSPPPVTVVPSDKPPRQIRTINKSERRVSLGRSFMSLLPREDRPSRRRRQSLKENARSPGPFLSVPPTNLPPPPVSAIYDGIRRNYPGSSTYNPPGTSTYIPPRHPDRESPIRCGCCRINFPNKEGTSANSSLRN
ncbi:hypothetical protein AAF712_006742 [Marasmius tenuissimus]|uniref:Uncharacterized protein n=1 Tax=Marasmius tenuissimus TaxID=585030 RepID=A0ABR2ZXI9_9AGAR